MSRWESDRRELLVVARRMLASALGVGIGVALSSGFFAHKWEDVISAAALCTFLTGMLLGVVLLPVVAMNPPKERP